MTEPKVCPQCGHFLQPGFKNSKGIICATINGYDPNVLCCEECWYEEPFVPAVINDKQGSEIES